MTDHKPIEPEHVADLIWRALSSWRMYDGRITVETVTHWLEYHSAGYPEVPLVQEKAREDAKFWATCATQPELEMYLAASLMELENSLLTGRAAKRLAALGWRKMTPEDKAAFKAWINKQDSEGATNDAG